MGPINHEVIPVGLLGALGGTLTGMVCVVVLGQPCHASVFTGMVVAACAIKGYPVLVHTMGQIRAVLLSILSMIKTFLSDQFDLSRRMARLFHERELLWQQNQAYRAEFDRMRQWERQLCALRHDMKNHLSVLRTYAALGQTEKLEQYLDRLWQPLIPPGFVHTGNPEIDSMLNYKLELAERAGARLELDVRLPEGFAADVFDLTIILGNLLDNALEGLKKSRAKALFLCLAVDRGVFFFKIANSYDGIVLRAGSYGDPVYRSRKQGKGHGLGLPAVRRMVDKYHGTLHIDSTGRMFSVEAVLYLNGLD